MLDRRRQRGRIIKSSPKVKSSREFKIKLNSCRMRLFGLQSQLKLKIQNGNAGRLGLNWRMSSLISGWRRRILERG